MKSIERIIKGNILSDFKKLMHFLKGYTKKMMKLIFLNLATHTLAILITISSKNLLDYAIANNKSKFVFFIVIYGVLWLLYVIIQPYIRYFKSVFKEELTNHLQLNFMKSYYALELSDAYKHKTGDILTRITKDINSIVIAFTTIIPSVIALLFQFIFAFIIVMNYDFTLGLLGFASLPIITVISIIFGIKMKNQHRAINKKEGEYRSFLNEAVQNMIIVRTFQVEDKFLSNVIKLQIQKFKLILKKTLTVVKSSLAINVGYTASSVALFIWGAYRISQGILSYGEFMAIIQLTGRMQMPIKELARLLPQYAASLAATERCSDFNQYLNYEYVPMNMVHTKVGIQVNDLSFGYVKDKTVLFNLNLDISPGEKIAIVGPSGIGKTTFMKLIMNLFTPNSGTLHPYTSEGVIENNHKLFSYVPQGNTLFSGSIRFNLQIGDQNASDQEMYATLAAACADEFIITLPDGLDSELGESGLGLSEGQLQRLSIARALLRKAPVLLLDEATSSLDQKTEEEVLSRIYKNYPEKTVIAITHRPSILNHVDRIIELDKEFGNTEDLINDNEKTR